MNTLTPDQLAARVAREFPRRMRAGRGKTRIARRTDVAAAAVAAARRAGMTRGERDLVAASAFRYARCLDFAA